MKKVYLIVSLLAVVVVTSCGNTDTTADETKEEVPESAGSVVTGTSGDADAKVIEAFAKDKSGITTADIDPNDTSFTTRSKALYLSEENGKKLAVVYGLKEKPNGLAIIEVEGEKPVTLKQTATAPGAQYEFTNGTITLKRVDKGVELNENGEVVTYKEIL